jgi:hypothetical protein
MNDRLTTNAVLPRFDPISQNIGSICGYACGQTMGNPVADVASRVHNRAQNIFGPIGNEQGMQLSTWEAWLTPG